MLKGFLYAEAIKGTRWALRPDPNYDPAHFIVGATLAMDKRTMLESVPHLERAARTLISAKNILAIIKGAAETGGAFPAGSRTAFMFAPINLTRNAIADICARFRVSQAGSTEGNGQPG